MKKARRQIELWVGISLVLHGLFFLFLFIFHPEKLIQWSGGRSGTSGLHGQAVWVEPVTIEGIGSSEEDSVKSEESERSELALKNEKAKKSGEEDQRKGSPTPKAQEGLQKGRSHSHQGQPGFGEGNSPTPAGGKGEGLESEGVPTSADTLAKIRQKIVQSLRYPALARKEGLTGVVHVSFRILPDGTVSQITILQPSNHPILDEEAQAAVKRAAPLPYYEAPISIPLKFDLKGRF